MQAQARSWKRAARKPEDGLRWLCAEDPNMGVSKKQGHFGKPKNKDRKDRSVLESVWSP